VICDRDCARVLCVCDPKFEFAFAFCSSVYVSL
jgi:hypothetical protein